MCLTLMTNAFIAEGKHFQYWKRTRLVLERNAFSARDKPLLALEMKAVKMHERYTLHLIGTVHGPAQLLKTICTCSISYCGSEHNGAMSGVGLDTLYISGCKGTV